jgi:hypothetical protein
MASWHSKGFDFIGKTVRIAVQWIEAWQGAEQIKFKSKQVLSAVIMSARKD